MLGRLRIGVVLMAVSAGMASPDVRALWAETLDKTAETAAIKFARTHHPELASLLDQLKREAPEEYQAAVTDLNRAQERLERNRERMPERYELELAEWKVNSRIRLMVARMSMSGDSPDNDELRAALRERADIRLQLLQDERARTAKRLQRYDEQIAEQESRRDDVIERDLAAILRGVQANAAKAAKEAKARESGVPAAKSPSARTPSKSKSKSEEKPRTSQSQDKKPAGKKSDGKSKPTSNGAAEKPDNRS